MFSRLAGKKLEKTNSDFDLDDMFESRANREVDTVAAESRDRQRAIIEHEKREKVLDSCSYCLDSQVHLAIYLFYFFFFFFLIFIYSFFFLIFIYSIFLSFFFNIYFFFFFF